MEIVDPRVNPALVPEGSRASVYGTEQPEYHDLPAIHLPSGDVITRWAPTDDERRRLFEGEDLYLTIKTHNNPLQPVMLTVGLHDWRD